MSLKETTNEDLKLGGKVNFISWRIWRRHEDECGQNTLHTCMTFSKNKNIIFNKKESFILCKLCTIYSSLGNLNNAEVQSNNKNMILFTVYLWFHLKNHIKDILDVLSSCECSQL